MKRVRVWFLGVLLAGLACQGEPAPDRETVVLVHGLGRSPASMMVLATRLERNGYGVVSAAYDSRGDAFSSQVAAVKAVVEGCCARSSRVHFVGHSLGGLVIRGYLAESPPERLGRVVLLAPPNQGSRLADRVSGHAVGQRVLGPVGSALGTDSADIPATLPPPDYDLGIIAGSRSILPTGVLAIPGPDDGIVGVDETRLEGAPMIVLPRSHTFIMNSQRTAQAVVRFLRTGDFGDDEAD